MSNLIKAGIAGGSGYTGGELIRILLNHPHVELSFVLSRKNAGKEIWQIHKDLIGETNLKYSLEPEECDILFLCLPHGESKKWLEQNQLPGQVRVIDLGNDFRSESEHQNRKFVYGLPEFQRDQIRDASNIANPGCFATGIQLGLLPLAASRLLKEVHTVGITGSTGAGQSLQDTTHFTWRANNISAYKTLTHQHIKEIHSTCIKMQPEWSGDFHFIPWRGDFTRGIFTSSMVSCPLPLDEIRQMYETYFSGHPFTHITTDNLDLKQVINTNKCVISLEKEKDTLAIHTAIDNLIKGAGGQAVQNMNLMYGWDETAGLKLKSVVF